jgi:hypothetical protein
VLNTEKNVKELSHQEIVKGVIFHKDLVSISICGKSQKFGAILLNFILICFGSLGCLQ